MNVSNDVKNAYKNGSHAKILNINFPDISYTVPQNEVYYESMALDEAIFDSDSFEVVGCIASQFSVSIRDSGENLKGEKVVVTLSLADVADSTIPLFCGYVDTVDREAQKKMQKITAYDALYSKGNTEVASWYNGLTFPITLGNFRNSLFTYIGITQITATLPNDNLVINKEYNPNTMKAINVIKSICQINGCFGMMTRTGEFEYRFLNTQDTPETVSFYRDIDYKDYVINPIDKLTIRQNTEDAGITIGSGDNLYIIQGNMFVYNLDASTIRTIANNIYSYLSGIEYIPFNAKNNGYPWIEVGKNCVLDYSVYDFEQSTSSQAVYKDVTVVALRRHLTGIQNVIDEYSAEGQELQREFISDISVDLEILQQTIENLSRQLSSEITTYRNASEITINDGNSVTIADMVYEADKGHIVIFHEEADFDVEPKETFSNNVYTEEEVVGTVRYYVDGYKLPMQFSEEVFREGKHILSLTQFWQAGAKNKSRFQAILTINGGRVSARKFGAQAYIMVKQSEYSEAGIEVTKMPDKVIYRPGETLDFTGLIISKIYYNESLPAENITTRCVYTPAEGSSVSSSDNIIDILVTYTEINEVGEEITYDTSFQLATQYLVGISVEHEPNKMEYLVDETLDLTGIKIVADYIDGTTRDVTASCSFSPANGTTLTTQGSREIIISYTEDGITCTTSITILVTKIVLTSITVVQDPTKMSYLVGDSLDLTGIQVSAEYSDGTSQDVTSSCTYSPADGYTFVSENEGTINISYTEDGVTCTTSIVVLVEPIPVFTGIAITTLPTKTEYYLGQALDYTGIVVEGQWSDGTSEIVTSSCTYNPENGGYVLADTNSTITVSYIKDGVTYTDTFEISILEPETSFVEYTDNVIDSTNKYVIINSLDDAKMLQHSITDVYIPTTCKINGETYTVLIGDDR